MSEISKTSQSNRLAYTSDNNRLSVSDGNNQTGGADETGGADRKSYLVNYIQQIQSDLENGDVHGGTLAQKKEWLQQALDMLHGEFPDSSGWDPTAESAPVGFQANVHPTSTSHSDTEKHFYYRTGSSTRVIIDRGDPNDPRPTTAEFWTTDNGIYLPDNASDVSYQYDAEAKTITVQVTIDGVTKTMIYHDVDRKGFKLKIEAANPDRVKTNLPAVLNGKVTVTQHKDETEGGDDDRLGDKPNPGSTEDGNPLYDITDPKKNLNLFPLKEGDDQTTIVRTRGTVNLTANSNSEYFKIKYNSESGMYEIKVYQNKADFDADQPKETIKVEAELLKSMDLSAIAPTHITFEEPLGNKDGTLNKSDTNAAKLKVDGVPTAQGTAPSTTDGNTATYKTPGDVSLTNDPTSEVTNHTITPTGPANDPTHPQNVTITVTPQDRVIIEKTTDNPPKYKVTVTSDTGKPQVYTVDSEGLNQLIIGGNLPASHLTLKGLNSSDIKKLSIAGNPSLLSWIANPGSFSKKDGEGLVPEGDGQEEALALFKNISQALLSGDPAAWAQIKDTVNGWSSDPDKANDRVRKLMTALWKAAGGTMDGPTADEMAAHPEIAAKFKDLLKMLPPEVREALKNAAGANPDELGEYESGKDIFTSAECIDILNNL